VIGQGYAGVLVLVMFAYFHILVVYIIYLDDIRNIAFCINKSANFHYIFSNHIENNVVSNIYSIIRLLSIIFRFIWFKSLRVT